MRKLWFKLINIVGVLSMITVLFSNVILATAEESNKNLNLSVVYPENKSGITATEDWVTVNLNVSIPNLKTGETMTLSMNSDEFSYSKTPFTIGQVKVTPNSDNTWTITALSDINNGNISLNLALRYTNYISEDTKKDITFTLKNSDGSNQTGTIEINVLKYVDLVSKKELVRKVPLGFTENGNIAWVIYLNYNQAGLTGSKETPFKIKDIVSENQELVSNSIAVYNVNTPTLIDSEGNKIRNQDHDDYNYEVSQFLQNHSSGTGIVYENSVNEIPDDNTNAYYIYLETKPDKEVASDEIFENSIYMSISYEGENAWEDQDLAIITKDKNSYGDGIGSVQLTKVDSNTGKSLSGAIFKIIDSTTGKLVKENLTTSVNGFIYVGGLEPGNYAFVETTAPPGYALSEEHYTFTINKDDVSMVNVTAENELLQSGKIKIVKQDKDTKAKLADAQFEVKNSTTSTKQVVTTDKNGEAIINGLSLAEVYEIKEIKAPTGYQLDSTIHKVTLSTTDTDKTVTVNVDNKAQENGSIKIVKQDKDTKAKLAGAQFEWTDTSNGFKGYISTNSNGEVTVSGLSINRTYEIKEIKAPTGYQLDSTIHKVTLSTTDTDKTVTVNVDNKAQENGSIKIVKQDKDTKAKLAGAQFEWTDTSNGFKGIFTVGSDGSYTLKNMSLNRTYEIKEIKAPTGYQLDSKVRKVTLSATDADKTVTVNVDNKAQENGSIKIIKQDVCTSQRLAGAQFEWTDTSNGYKGYVSTNSNGETIISGLSVNRTYEIKEIRAPEGYQLDSTVHRITLNANETNTTKAIVLCNQQKFTSILNKYIDCYGNTSNVRIRAVENFSPAKQIEYKIYQKDGKLAKHLFTGLDGYTMYFSLVKGWDYDVYKVFSGREIFDFSFKY